MLHTNGTHIYRVKFYLQDSPTKFAKMRPKKVSEETEDLFDSNSHPIYAPHSGQTHGFQR